MLQEILGPNDFGLAPARTIAGSLVTFGTLAFL
jgi:hypothetical protein